MPSISAQKRNGIVVGYSVYLGKEAAEHVRQDPRHPFAVFVNAWNEWTEYSFLLPEKRYGLGYLKELKKALG